MIIDTENYTITPELIFHIEVMCDAVELHIKAIGNELSAMLGNDFVTGDFFIQGTNSDEQATVCLHMYAKDDDRHIRQVEFVDYQALFMSPEECTRYLQSIAEQRRINTEKLDKHIAEKN